MRTCIRASPWLLSSPNAYLHLGSILAFSPSPNAYLHLEEGLGVRATLNHQSSILNLKIQKGNPPCPKLQLPPPPSNVLSPPAAGKRKEGGQPGNRNAFRHGFYSKSFTEEELLALDENIKGENVDEIAAARITSAHLLELMKDYKRCPSKNFISAANALNNYLDRIQSLSRATHFLYRKSTTAIEQAMEELSNSG